MTGIARPVKIKNTKTGKVITFNSLRECGEFFGTSRAALSNQLNFRKHRLYHGYIVRDKNDKTPWPDKKTFSKNITKSGDKVETKVTDTVTGMVENYTSIAALAAFFGVAVSTITYYVNRKSNPSIYRGYLIERMAPKTNLNKSYKK